MKLGILNQTGEKVKDIKLSDAFAVTSTPEALTLYINYLRAALRAPIANTKDRSEVSGGGRKPWKQKGTGSARVGSTRSPLWIGGGVTFGPTNDRNYKLSINKTAKRKAILTIFGKLAENDQIVVVDSFNMDKPNTKNAIAILGNLKAEGKITVILNESNIIVEKSFRNIPGIHIMFPNKLDMINLMTSSKVIVTVDSLSELEKTYVKQ
ncbi:MAG: 50S ribosomal protein L4 [bacterium]